MSVELHIANIEREAEILRWSMYDLCITLQRQAVKLGHLEIACKFHELADEVESAVYARRRK